MTNRHHLTRSAHQVYADAHALATDLDAALQALDDSIAGYPASTPGAAPSSESLVLGRDDFDEDGNPAPVTLTSVERAAGRHDAATHDREQLIRAIKASRRHTARAAAIAARWSKPAVDATTVAKRLASVTEDQGIWCRNCIRHGHSNPREGDRADCEFCRKFRSIYGVDAPAGVLEIRATRKLYVQDIVRILDRDVPGWRKKQPKPKRQKAS